ncbi:MAG TPA: S8 family serine peptidase [Myxococcales bacterium]|jgi:serine protease
MASTSSSPRSAWAPFVLSSLAVLVAVATVGNCAPDGKQSEKSKAPVPLSKLTADDFLADELVVDFKDGITKERYDQLEKQWGVDLEFNSIEGAVDGITLGRIDPARLDALLAKIAQDPNVEAVEPLYRYKASFVPNDPRFKEQWNFEMIHMRDAWEKSQGEGAVVAVLDTGIAYEDNGEFKTVPDLRGAKFAKGYDFVNDDDHPNDDHGHGTHVAGTIAQVTNNGLGVAGIAYKATLMPVKVLDANGSGSSADIADAIRWAADHGAKVINMSLGGGGRSQVMESAVAYARGKGVVVVCAAGNAARGTVEFPAAYPGAVAVSAVGPTGELASYSSYGKELDIAAPGGDKRLRGRDEDGVLQNTIIPSNPAESQYAYFNGTSMATPHVAGVAALLWAAGAKTPDQVEQALFKGADHTKSGEWSDKFGHGLLDAKGALEALAGGGGGAKVPWWKKILAFVWAFLLWLLARFTLPLPARRLATPGLGFLAGLLLTTLGFFFLPWLGLGHLPVLGTLATPMPEWGAAIFGAGPANPLFYSALIPILFAFVGFRRSGWQGAIAGVAVGWAALLLMRAFSDSPAVAWMPLSFLSVPWLIVNVLVLFVLARAALRASAEDAR